MTAPVRGRRRRGTPSLVLPGDPDGCGWFAIGGGEYVPFPSPPTGHPARERRTVRYVGRPSHWGNPYRVVKGRSGLLGVITPDEQAVNLRPDCTAPEAARVAVRGFRHHLDHLDRSKPPVVLAQHLAPLVTADVLSCWCPLDQPCHADPLCDLVGRLRSGDLVPGLVATPDVCGGALRIDGTDLTVELAVQCLDDFRRRGCSVEDLAGIPVSGQWVPAEMVRVAARVGGAL